MLSTNYHILCALLIVTSCFSCQKKADHTELGAGNNQTDSILFELSEIDFEAVLIQKNENVNGYAVGTGMWQRSGSLSAILSDLYDKPTILNKDLYSRNTYDLNITWSEGETLADFRKKVGERLQKEFNYNLTSEIREETVLQLAIHDKSLLNKSQVNAPELEGTTSKVIIQNNQWEYFGTVKGLSEFISEQTGRTILYDQDANVQETYYFQLDATYGYSGIAEQLEKNFGIIVNEDMILVEYVVIEFI